MKLPKWLLLQMTQMRTTCSKKEKKVILPSFFLYYNTPQKPTFLASKTAKKYQNVGQMLPELRCKIKEKTLTTLFLSY